MHVIIIQDSLHIAININKNLYQSNIINNQKITIIWQLPPTLHIPTH